MVVPTETVTSSDGTRIAFERVGEGPPLILIDAAGHFRGLSSFGGLIPRLTAHFTVYHYDRRGRGESGDAPGYAVQREIEDLDALIGAARGPAFVHAFSSGGLIALHAAAGGLAIERMSLLEPPVGADDDRAEQIRFTARLAALVEAGRHPEAVEFFLSGIGVPGEMVSDMRATPAWTALVGVAPTLVYDALLSESVHSGMLASVKVPTLALDSAGSSDDLTGMAARLASQLPAGQHRSLPGGWHGVADEVLAPALTEFLLAG